MTRLSVEIYCDGACRGNPGPSAAGAVLSEAGSRRVIGEISERLGRGTNNEAEYAALLLALEEARRLGATEVSIKADSQLVIRQLNGQYKVKHPEMKKRHARALELLSGFSIWNASHVPREENVRADALANAALDRS